MPIYDASLIGGSVFNYQRYDGTGPTYQNPGANTSGSQVTEQTFGGLWVIALLAIIGVIVWFLFLR
jgi:hypothetical protein